MSGLFVELYLDLLLNQTTADEMRNQLRYL